MTFKTTLRWTAILAVAALLTLSVSAQSFSNYASVGDSLTAGFQSGGLTEGAQTWSYPALIYGQANGSMSGFEQPTVSAPGIPALLQLASLAGPVIAPSATPDNWGSPTNLTLPRPYNNVGVPGATIHDAVATVTDGGGLHDLILRGLGTQVQQAFALGPSYITVWLGNNDTLGAATSGLVIEGVTLTKLNKFEDDYRTMAQTLAATGAPMVFATLPEVTAIPFVTTVPPILLDSNRQPVVLGGSLVPLIGPDGPLALNDFVLLTAAPNIAMGYGIPPGVGTGLPHEGEPLKDQWVLSASEASTILDRGNAFNNVIRTVAAEVGAGVWDANAYFRNVTAHGLNFGGVEVTNDLLTGGLFSYDGVHPTGFGYAVIANQFINAINAHSGMNIPPVNLGPFLYDGRGSVTNLGVDPFFLGGASSLFTPEAGDQVHFSTGLPSIAKLLRIKKRREENRPNRPPKPGYRPGDDDVTEGDGSHHQEVEIEVEEPELPGDPNPWDI